jgi:fructan beta-fructosidase
LFGVPEKDGRLFVGWMNNWSYADAVPTENWRSAMTVAWALTLENTPAGLRVASNPGKELKHIYGETFSLQEKTVAGGYTISEQLPFKATTFDLTIALEPAGSMSDFKRC